MADNSINDILSKIAENPDIISKISSIAKDGDKENMIDRLPEIMEAISPAVSITKSEENTKKADTSPAETGSQEALQLPKALTKISEKISKNSQLLIALKPYLSKERCEIIDNVVKMTQVSELMRLVK
ncbi:MAG: hypothetical protein IJX02_05575 [Clostridia bacterium]|nr:hypothetical protein [Clostridia bacterium]